MAYTFQTIAAGNWSNPNVWHSTYNITSVNTGAKTFRIAGNHADEFVSGSILEIASSTGNNGIYTVVSAVYTTYTTLTVSETVSSAVIDGNIRSQQLPTWDGGTLWDIYVYVDHTIVMDTIGVVGTLVLSNTTTGSITGTGLLNEIVLHQSEIDINGNSGFLTNLNLDQNFDIVLAVSANHVWTLTNCVFPNATFHAERSGGACNITFAGTTQLATLVSNNDDVGNHYFTGGIVAQVTMSQSPPIQSLANMVCNYIDYAGGGIFNLSNVTASIQCYVNGEDGCYFEPTNCSFASCTLNGNGTTIAHALGITRVGILNTDHFQMDGGWYVSGHIAWNQVQGDSTAHYYLTTSQAYLVLGDQEVYYKGSNGVIGSFNLSL